MKHFLLLILGVFSGVACFSQAHCDGTRYIQEVFTEIDSTIGVQYGQNTTVSGASRNLRMDLYYPAQEFFFKRPAVVLAHGGSFIGGNRQQMRLLCQTLARHGFVAATIDYRLYDDFNQQVDSITIYDVVVKATSDMKAAVRWLKNSASTSNAYGIDSNLIIVGGVSAGAITALQHGFLDEQDIAEGSVLDSVIQANGGIRGNSNGLLGHSDHVLGILSYSGALKEAKWVDAGEPTVFSVHDEFDQVVPYDRAITDELGTPVEVSGSADVHAFAVEKGIRTQLMTIAGSNEHVSYFLNGANTSDYVNVVDSSMRFLEYTVCDRISGQKSHTVPSINVYPNPAQNEVHVRSVYPIKEIQLIDVSGRMVRTTTSSSIDVSELNTGQYFLRIQHLNNEVVQRSLLVE